jgi:hypothetical protein
MQRANRSGRAPTFAHAVVKAGEAGCAGRAGAAIVVSSETIAIRYWERPGASTKLALFERTIWPTGRTPTQPAKTKENPMKKLIIAVALVVASASPVLAEAFPNVYMTR